MKTYNVNPLELTPIQLALHENKLHKLLENFNEDLCEPILVIEHEKLKIIADGHHHARYRYEKNEQVQVIVPETNEELSNNSRGLFEKPGGFQTIDSFIYHAINLFIPTCKSRGIDSIADIPVC